MRTEIRAARNEATSQWNKTKKKCVAQQVKFDYGRLFWYWQVPIKGERRRLFVVSGLCWLGPAVNGAEDEPKWSVAAGAVGTAHEI